MVTDLGRPARAPAVELHGELPGSGFVDRQWLIQRNGQFIQLGELLYRVLEQVNGERSADEIATAVTERTDWLVTPANVQEIIQTKLVPLQLVRTTVNTSSLSSGALPRDQTASPLMIGMRLKVLPPGLIESVTRVLQYFFVPPVLVFLLVLSTAANLWLYFAHGVVASIYDILTTPGHLVVVLLIVIGAAVFHEFGHAAALRYGGGKVRGMGVGFYLIYPTFYTDVTDAYRLERSSRLRTDLGGVYFHALFSLGIIVASLVTGQDYLLSVAVLVDLDILDQFFPFARLDGYWTLADLTGVPDFFSLIGPYIQSLSPGLNVDSGQLPRLKPGVKLAFTTYVAIALPVLAYVFYQLAANLPSIVSISWVTISTLVSELAQAWVQRDVLGELGFIGQLVVVVLPMLGLLYFLFSLRKPLRMAWTWCRPTPARRGVGVLGVFGLVGLLTYLWLPWLPIQTRTIPDGVQHFNVTDRAHVAEPVFYPQTPPVGGRHWPVWQNCGYYPSPIHNENGVHSLEHGAVWITYRTDLPSAQVDALRQIADQESYVVVSPYPGLPAPLVASAWSYQLRLNTVDDPRLEQFLSAFREGPQAPERGGPCEGGTGTPQ